MQHLRHIIPQSRRRNGHVSVAPNQPNGFSLIEVLVSIIILSFGLLGMVGLQATALQSNREARMQSSAGSLARELAEMMRGNKEIAVLPTSATNPYLGDFSSPLASATASYCLNVATATPACGPNNTLVANTVIAQAQMTEWLSRVDSELPGARVSICVDGTPYDANGLPQWACNATGVQPNMFVKIGWTKGSINRASLGALALERATRPSVIFPVSPGNAGNGT